MFKSDYFYTTVTANTNQYFYRATTHYTQYTTSLSTYQRLTVWLMLIYHKIKPLVTQCVALTLNLSKLCYLIDGLC